MNSQKIIKIDNIKMILIDSKKFLEHAGELHIFVLRKNYKKPKQPWTRMGLVKLS